MKKEPNPKKKKKKEKKPKKERRTLREKFNAAFGKLEWKDIGAIGKETLKDMRRPKEIFAMVAGVLVPGGLPAYIVYRVVKYRAGQKPANDNTEQKKKKKKKPKPPAP